MSTRRNFLLAFYGLNLKNPKQPTLQPDLIRPHHSLGHHCLTGTIPNSGKCDEKSSQDAPLSYPKRTEPRDRSCGYIDCCVQLDRKAERVTFYD